MEALADPDAPGYEVAPGLVLEHPARKLFRDRKWLLSRRRYYKTTNRIIEEKLREFGDTMENAKKAGRPFETWFVPQPPTPPRGKPTKATQEQFAALYAALRSPIE
jgi:hypothetical protein